MTNIPVMTESNLPEEGLQFFHGLANWVEATKSLKISLIEWKKGQKKLTLLNCFKSKPNEPLLVPEDLPENSLYIPNWISGRKTISQLRHAFCHGKLEYEEKTKLYRITPSDRVKIAGSFSLETIQEFVNVYLEPKERKDGKKNEN